METMVFQSPKKHRIIAVKYLLRDNNIPITSVKISIYVEWSHGGRRGAGRVKEIIEKRDELNIDIEFFNEKLNDAQTFEIYVDEKHEEAAINLIENINIETFFDDCIFKSTCYDAAFDVCKFLKKNKISCDEIFTTDDGYLVFIDIEKKEEALKLLEVKAS